MDLRRWDAVVLTLYSAINTTFALIPLPVQHRVGLPLVHPPPNGYAGVATQSTAGPSSSFSSSSSNHLPPWPGPCLDWLSSTEPKASPYVPQMGDRVVYVVRGHKDYLSRAWQDGQVPERDDHEATEDGVNAKQVPLPWDTNATLPVSRIIPPPLSACLGGRF